MTYADVLGQGLVVFLLCKIISEQVLRELLELIKVLYLGESNILQEDPDRESVGRE